MKFEVRATVAPASRRRISWLTGECERGWPRGVIAPRFTAAATLFGLAVAIGVIATGAGAQTGSIQFEVRATPASGIEEPVRGFPFYLLSKSFEDITKEAAASYPLPDMDAFIDKLGASRELKAWMKKNRCVQLSGEDFLQKVKPEDVITVPEFYSAYLQSSGAGSLDFPRAKYKPVDKTKDPGEI